MPAITHKPLPGARVLLRPCECRPVCAYVIYVYYGYIKAVCYMDYRVRFWGLKSPWCSGAKFFRGIWSRAALRDLSLCRIVRHYGHKSTRVQHTSHTHPHTHTHTHQRAKKDTTKIDKLVSLACLTPGSPPKLLFWSHYWAWKRPNKYKRMNIFCNFWDKNIEVKSVHFRRFLLFPNHTLWGNGPNP